MTKRHTILIVDDHPLFREGLKSIIERSPIYDIVGETGTGLDALRMTKQLRPDLVLLDVALPDRSGIEIAREIKSSLSETLIMIISMHSKVGYITEAFQAGATGYLAKDSASAMLLQGIEAVLRGDYFMDSSVSHEVAKRLMKSPEKEAKISDAAYEKLTSREQEIMALLAEGIPARQIAEKLFISPKTVENHRANIMRKLGLHSAHQLVRYAAKLGLIDVDLWKE